MIKFNLKRNTGACVALLYMLFSFWSCDPDFTDKDYLPDQYQANDTIWVNEETTDVFQAVALPVKKGEWRLIQYPEWFQPTARSGQVGSDYTVTISGMVDQGWLSSNYYFWNTELIVSVDGFGLVYISFAYLETKDQTGTGAIFLWPATLFIQDDQEGSFSLKNDSEYDLSWTVASMPDWLRIDETWGYYSPYDSYDINYHANISGMDPGTYSGDIVFWNNSKQEYVYYKVVLTVTTASAGDFEQGELVGSVFLKSTNQAVVLTKNPNQLRYYTPGANESEVVELDRVPRCICLSEDGNVIAIGFTNTEVSTYDVSTKELVNTYDLDAVPLSLAWGAENYFYFTSSIDGYYTYVNSYNLTTGETQKASGSEGGIKGLKKLPGKNIVLTSLPGWGPEFIYYYYHTDEGAVEDLNKYWVSPKGFWPSEDGETILTGSKKVYEIPEYDPDFWGGYDVAPPIDGEYELPTDYIVHAIASQSAAEKMYVASGNSYYSSKTYVTVFNSATYVQLASYEFASARPAAWSGSTWWEETQAIYPVSDGSQVWLVQQYPAVDYNDPDQWDILLKDLN